MSEEPAIDKIKKLLRLGRSANRHEAELAMQRAFELAEKHRIDVEQLDLDEREAAVVHEWFKVGQRISFLKKRALAVVMRFFHVNVCLSTPEVVFVGRATDIAIAHYVFEFLVRTATRLLRAFESGERAQRRKVNHAKRTNYIHGFIYGIVEKLDGAKQTMPLTDSQSAIVVAEDRAREDYLKELIPNQRTKRIEGSRRNKTALMAGYHDGKKTSIHQPIAGTPGAPLLLQ